jgi:hypothetical protein
VIEERPEPPLVDAVDLARPRDLGDIVSTTLAVYFRHWRVFLAIATAVVVPIALIVSGMGLGGFTGGYEEDPPAAAGALETVVGVLITTPLITAMHVTAVMDVASGRPPSARRSIQAGLDVFPPLLAAMLLYVLGVFVGFLALILPGIYLAVRWYFVPQVVVVDGRRGADALRRSSELVTGSWWRVLGIAIVFNLLAAVVALPLGLAADAAAREADVDFLVLIGTIAGQALTLSFLALATALLYFDLRARRGDVWAPGGDVLGRR